MNDEADSPQVGTREYWRLGHRRPWWQWNVLTLFAMLFALIWARELIPLSQTATWMLCIAVLGAWSIGPALILGPPIRFDRSEDNERSPAEPWPVFFAASMGMLGGVFYYGGATAGMLCILAMIFILAAALSPRK
jgi:hypothetical protein